MIDLEQAVINFEAKPPRMCSGCKVVPVPSKSAWYCSPCRAAIRRRKSISEIEEPLPPPVLPARYVFAPKPEPMVQHRNWRIQPPKRNVFGEPIQDFGAGMSVGFLSAEQVEQAKANRNQKFEHGVYRG